MSTVMIYEQECWGATHYRVMRHDGRLIFGRIATDFPSRDEALSAVLGEFWREKLGPVKVTLCSNGKMSVLHEGEPAPKGWSSVTT